MSDIPTWNQVHGPGGGYEIVNGRVTQWYGESPPWVLFVGDYNQLEIRLLAHASRDPTLIDAILRGLDIHALTAQACFDEVPKHISLAEVKEHFGKYRKDAKPVSFGVIYGMGPKALAAAIGVTEEEAAEIINDRYMALYPGVKAYIERMHARAKKLGEVRTAMGRPRHLPAAMLNKWDGPNNRRLVSKACRQAQNAPIQGFASDIIELAMRNMRRFFRETTTADVQQQGRLLKPMAGSRSGLKNQPLYRHLMRPNLQVHDEMVMEAHPAVANFMCDEVVRLMETAVEVRVPLKVDARLGTNWKETKA